MARIIFRFLEEIKKLDFEEFRELSSRKKKAEFWKFMSSKIIIIATVILLIASFSVLFVIESKNHDYDYKKAWSVVYFENPRDESLDFAIENHEGQDGKYNYNVFAGDDELIDGDIDIPAGAKQKISPVIPNEKLSEKKILIDVNYKGTEYKIYKSMGK